MKRIFTLMLAVVAIATSASAVNLWKGSYTPHVSPTSECPKIEAKTFADTKEGAALVFTLTPTEGDGWKAVELWSDGGSYLGSQTAITLATTKVEVVLSEGLLGKLKSYGFFPGGTGYNVTSIDLNAPEHEFDGTMWSGSQEMYNWGGFTIPASNFALLKEGNTLCIDATPTGDVWAGLNLVIAGGNGDIKKDNVITAAQPTYKFELTAEQVGKIIAHGIYMTGYNVKLTKVYVEGVSTGVEMPAVDARVSAAVYTLTGVKVAASLDEAGKLAPGIYVSGGKKFVVR